MLVVSRRPNEEIVFANLGITVKVLRTLGNRVRLGIQAPEFVEIRRGELSPEVPQELATPSLTHFIRNELNSVHLSLELYERQMSAGQVDAANHTFMKLLSRLRRADGEQAVTSAATPTSALEVPQVLVVDDDANERELLAGLLQMDGCSVSTASDGRQALDQLQNQPADVVLLDMHMPRLDGKQTLLAIRSHQQLRKLLVFGISGSSWSDYGITLNHDTGVDEWFDKPLNPNLLVTRMRARLQSSTNMSP